MRRATYGKNLNAFTSKVLAVNASLISSSVTVALRKGKKKEKVFIITTIFLPEDILSQSYLTLNRPIKIFLFINF